MIYYIEIRKMETTVSTIPEENIKRINQWDNELWTVIDSYFKNTDNYMSKNQLDSYNRFLEINLPKTIRQFNPLILSYHPTTFVVPGTNQTEEGYYFEVHVTLGGSVEEISVEELKEDRSANPYESRETVLIDGTSIRVTDKKVNVINDGTHIYVNKPIIQELYTSDGKITGQLHQKPLYPNEARLKNITYRTDLLIDVIIDYRIHPYAHFQPARDGITSDTTNFTQPRVIRRFEKVPLGSIPVMLQSKICSLYGMKQETLHQMGECEYDHGGYFIIDGKEKVIVAQERQVENMIYVSEIKDASSKNGINYRVMSEVRSAPEHRFQPARITNVFVARRSVTKNHQFYNKSYDTNVKVRMVDMHEDGLYVRIPQITQDIPLFVVFRALGIVSDYEIIHKIMASGSLNEDTVLGKRMMDFLQSSKAGATIFYPELYHYDETLKVSYQREIDNMADARMYIASFIDNEFLPEKIQDKEVRMAYLDIIFKEHFLPHVGSMNLDKADYLSYMAYETLLSTFGIKKFTDRDSYMHKRVDLAGYLVATLFRDLYFRVKNRLVELCNINHSKRDVSGGFWLNDDKDTYFWRELPANLKFTRYQLYRFIGSELEPQTILRADQIVDRRIVDDGFMFAFKNAWGLKNAPGNKEGVVQDLARLSYVGFVSHLRRINTPLSASAKVRAPHTLHMSSWGIMCPSETPDGGNIGLRKNLSIFAVISSGSNSMTLLRCMVNHGLESNLQADPTRFHQTKVFLNDRIVGYVRHPIVFCKKLRLLKRNAIINVYTSISFNIEHNWIKVNTDSGRGMRPVLVVDSDNQLDIFKKVSVLGGKDVFSALKQQSRNSKVNWMHLIGGFRNHDEKVPFNDQEEMYLNDSDFESDMIRLEEMAGVIEYIDKTEEDNAMIAVSIRDLSYKQYRYHYCEIHPSLILGLLANCVPFIEMNPGPRHLYAVGQSKQALGMYASNFRNRMDTKGQVMYYPQRSIVRNRLERYLFTPEMPNGINAIVAIGCFSGYNQEDSIIFNKASVERGLFRTVKYRTYSAREEIENGKIRERIMKPVPTNTHEMKPGNYSKLDENGLIIEGSKITENDILIGKCAVSSEKDGKTEYVDTSDYVRRNEDGYVDKVFSNIGNEGQRYVKVRVRKDKKPELGDKFCSRYGQKGTVGMLMEPQDMPMTAEGIQPDLIVNAHAFPSRMTIAQFLELILGKACTELGLESEVAAFSEVNAETIGNSLESVGFERHGHEVMYNGRTGEMLKVNYFIGPTYYQRLTHQVSDKYQSRDDGSRTALTHQPVGGRSLGGGGRIGEMERDALLSHGVSAFLKESMMERSDKSSMVISQNTGVLAVYNPERQIYRDFMTDESIQEFDSVSNQMVKRSTEPSLYANQFATIEIPYSFKLLLQEIEAMGISLKLITENKQTFWKDTPLTDADTRMMSQFEQELAKFPVNRIKSPKLWKVMEQKCSNYIEPGKRSSIQSILSQMKKDKQIIASKYSSYFNTAYIMKNKISFNEERAISRLDSIDELFRTAKYDAHSNMRRFLDVGASDGTITSAIAERWNIPREDAHGIDIDISPYMTMDVGDRVNITTYPRKNYTGYESNTMDVVFFHVVFHHVPLHDRIPLLHEVYRIVRPGGYVVFREHDMPYDRDSEEWQFMDAIHAIHMIAKNEDMHSYYAEYFTKEQLKEYMKMTGFIEVTKTNPRGNQYIYEALYQKPDTQVSERVIQQMNAHEDVTSMPFIKRMKYHTVYYDETKDDIVIIQKVDVRDTDDVSAELKDIQNNRVRIMLGYKQPALLKSGGRRKSPEPAENSIRVTIDSKEVDEPIKGGMGIDGDVNDGNAEAEVDNAVQMIETMNEHSDVMTNEQYEAEQEFERKEHERESAHVEVPAIDAVTKVIPIESGLPSEIQDTMKEYNQTMPENKDADYNVDALAEKTRQVVEVINVPMEPVYRDVIDLDMMDNGDGDEII